jgi:hypothetical protein
MGITQAKTGKEQQKNEWKKTVKKKKFKQTGRTQYFLHYAHLTF